MKKALILQGWYQKPEDNWYPWLRTELEKKGYDVYLPDLPTMHIDTPSLVKQLRYIEKNFDIDKNTLVFGHSLGVLLALRLAEIYKFKKMFLVAGWDFDDLTYEHRLFWKNKLDHSRIKANVKEIYCIGSDNDPYFTSFTVEQMSKRLGGEFVMIKGKGHFTRKDGVTKLPEIMKFID